jgi:hypothetical protein
MSQLLRLYNNEADHIILLHDGSIDCQDWVREIEDMPTNWKKPAIHLIQAVRMLVCRVLVLKEWRRQQISISD